MSIINTSMSDYFTSANTLITNAQNQAAIGIALEAFGYDAAAIQEGQALLTTARSLYDTQIKEYGEQYAATQAFETACQQADKTYAAHRKLAKIAFKTDSLRQTDLHLNQPKPKLYAPWYEQARHFYIALLADTDAQTQVDQAEILKSAQEKEKGEVQDATQQRNAALQALDNWLADFKVIARLVLEDSPQLLESLKLGASLNRDNPLSLRGRAREGGLVQSPKIGPISSHSIPLHTQPSSFHTQPSSFHTQPSSFHAQPSSFHAQQPSFHAQQPSFHAQQPSFHAQPSSFHA